jgi:phage/plasmid-associated DNA primase
MENQYAKIYLDSEDDIVLIDTFIGNSIDRKPTNKILIFHGTGGNGKSTFIKKMTGINGIETCYLTSLEGLLDDEILINIITNDYNIVVIHDLKSYSLTAAQKSRLQSILAHESIKLQKKYYQACSYTPMFNILCDTNENNVFDDLSAKTNKIHFNKKF